MKLYKRKRRDTSRSARELVQLEQLTGVTPIDILPSEEICRFMRDLPDEVRDKLKHCSADPYNTDMFDEKIHRAFAAEAQRKASEYDRNLHTVHTICQIHCGIYSHLEAQERLYAEDIAAAEKELAQLAALQRTL